MLKSVYNRFFPEPSVSSILLSFQKTQDQLADLQTRCHVKEAGLCEQIDAATADLEATVDERAKASRIAQRLSDFTS